MDPLSWRFLRSESRPSDSIQLFLRKFIAVVSSYSEWLAEASAQFAAPSLPEGALGILKLARGGGTGWSRERPDGGSYTHNQEGPGPVIGANPADSRAGVTAAVG